MNRFFYNLLAPTSTEVTLTDKKEIHHLKNVLRIKKEETVILFNGKNLSAQGTIKDINTNSVTIRINSFEKNKITNQKSLTLACAIPKKAKFEFILEKCTELGVDTVVPLLTKRTEVKITPKRAKEKILRYQKIAINAAKQCQRNTVPHILPFTNFQDFIKTIDTTSAVFIPNLEVRVSHLNEALQKEKEKQNFIFLIGPEGDFTADEILQAKEKGAIPISLGKTTLKVDTAAISVAAFFNFTFHNETH